MKLEKTTSKAFKRVENKNQKNAFSRDRQKSPWPIIISGDPYDLSLTALLPLPFGTSSILHVRSH